MAATAAGRPHRVPPPNRRSDARSVMRIGGIRAVFPRRVVENDEILDMIAHESARSYQGDLVKSGVLCITGGLACPICFASERQRRLNGGFPPTRSARRRRPPCSSPNLNAEWEFHFSSRTDLADLCQVPERNYRGYCVIGLENGGAYGHACLGAMGRTDSLPSAPISARTRRRRPSRCFAS